MAFSFRLGVAGVSLIAWALPSLGHAATLAEVTARGYLTVGVPNDAPPFAADRNGTPVGLGPDLLAALGRQAPFTIRTVIGADDLLLADIKDGTIDLIAGDLTITPDLQKRLDFTAPIADRTLYWITRQDNTIIHAIADLAGKSFGVRDGNGVVPRLHEVAFRLARAGIALGSPVRYETDEAADHDLAAGKIDYVIGFAGTTPDGLVRGQAVTGPSYSAWAVAKGNTTLHDFIDRFFDAERKGDLAALQVKWLGEAPTALPASWTATDWWHDRPDFPLQFPNPNAHVQD